MQTNVIWIGKSYNSMENCVLTKTVAGNEITSTIIGVYENHIYKVEYHIQTNKNWETKFATLKSQIDNLTEQITFENKKGIWLLNDKPNDEFKNIVDIDISLTPFTNTLPINRLKIKDNEPHIIDVLYFDILKKEIRPVKQIYTRLTPKFYVYENYHKKFTAKIKIDKQGLVVKYPKLFKMTFKQKSHYH